MVKFTLLMVVFGMTATISAQPFTKEIIQFANTGNRAELQGLRSKSLNAEEKVIVNALLEIDGAVAAKAFQSVIVDNPASPFARLIDVRLKEYNLAVGGGYASRAVIPAPIESPKPIEPKPSDSAPIEPKPVESSPPAVAKKPAPSGLIRFAVQFGSFYTRSQAEVLQKKLRAKVSTRILEIDDGAGRTAYKVRSENFYNTKPEATLEAKKLKVDYYVVAE